MPDKDAELYRAEHAREHRSRSEWVEAVLAQAEILHRKRNDLRSDQAFGAWLRNNGVGEIHSHQDRAALIGLGGDLTLAREVLVNTNRRSPQHIWDEVRSRFTHVSKPVTAPNENGFISSPKPLKALDRVARFVQEQGNDGVTAVEVVEKLGLESAAARLSELSKSGVLVKSPQQRDGRSVYVHRDFAAAKWKKAKPIPKTRTIVPSLEDTRWVREKMKALTNEELEYPSPETAHLPDPDRPGLNRAQGYVARWGHVQIAPIKERKRSIAKRLHTMIRKLDEPLTDYIEQAAMLVTADEVVELMQGFENPLKDRGRLIDAVRAVRENAQRMTRHIESLEAALFDQSKELNQPENPELRQLLIECAEIEKSMQ